MEGFIIFFTRVEILLSFVQLSLYFPLILLSVFLFLFPCHFSSLSYTYLSLHIALLTSTYFAWKVTVISPFDRPLLFFGIYCSLMNYSDYRFRAAHDLQEAYWRWTL